MDVQGYIDIIKVRLSGNLVDLELSDDSIKQCINAALLQVQRHIDSTMLITIPYQQCIDLSNKGVNSVSRVFRSEGYMSSDNQPENSFADPMYMASWQLMSGTGSALGNMSVWAQNYAAYNTALQLRNTMSTDLVFRFDKHTNQLYINCGFDRPQFITIEFVPHYTDVSQVVSDFWIDILLRLSTAICKQAIGRIRKKFSQSNALWTLDTDILQEGIEEENAIREKMEAATQLTYPVD